MCVFVPDSEPTEPLSVDGNSSELDMEELEGEEGGETTVTPVPQTPDQEAFLKQHFGTLADLETIGTVRLSSSTASPAQAGLASSTRAE